MPTQHMSQTVDIVDSTGRREKLKRLDGERASRSALFYVAALLFAVSAVAAVAWRTSMPAMGAMARCGGPAMSMMWLPAPGQAWLSAAAAFVGMWSVMMVAMMLPSLLPMLWRYRQAVGATGAIGAVATIGAARLGRLTVLVGLGYFSVWTACGMAAFALGSVLAMLEIHWPALTGAGPFAIGLVVLLAGALQCTAWKARRLACCRAAPGGGASLAPDAGTAWRHGLRLGRHCCYCCAGLTAILLVTGMMDWRVMAVVTLAITAERLAPAAERVARAIGAGAVATGLCLIARAAGLA